MTDSPFMSFMIPVYNGEDLVCGCIESILSQPCTDYEILILDDGSTDKTSEICQRYAEANPCITVICHENMGLGKNRNMGFPYAHGKCIIFIDHDDLILPNFYTDQTKKFIEDCFMKDVDVIVPARLRCDYSASIFWKEENNVSGVFVGNSLASWNVQYEFATLIYNLDSLRKNKIFFSETKPEMETIFRHKAVCCSPRVLFTNSFWFAIRRDNPQQITKNWNSLSVSRVRFEEYQKLLYWHENRETSQELLNKTVANVKSVEEDYLMELISQKRDLPENFVKENHLTGLYRYLFLARKNNGNYKIAFYICSVKRTLRRVLRRLNKIFKMIISRRKIDRYIISIDKQKSIYEKLLSLL